MKTIHDVVINPEHRDKMIALETAILDELEPAEIEHEHYYSHGVYTRVMYLPAGTVLTGKIHRHSCINILSKGKMKVVTDEGEYEIEAPYTFVSGPGVKKAGYALEDSIWINCHPWDGEADLSEIEQETIVPSYEALEQEQNLIGGQ